MRIDDLRCDDDEGAGNLAPRINRAHRACENSARAAVEHAVRAGELLLEAKAAVGHGCWLDWLADNFAGSADTAQTYMRLARAKAEVIDANTGRARYLSIREARTAISPSEPEPPAFLSGLPSEGPPADEPPPNDGLLGGPPAHAGGESDGEDAGPGPRPREPLTRCGEIILLGRHRLMCSDATDSAAVRRLVAGEKAAVVWSDPPWGVRYEGKTKAALKLQGDSPDRAPELFADALVVAEAEALQPGAAYYLVRPSGQLAVHFGRALTEVGWSIRQELVWQKNVFVLGHGDYHYRHETLYYGYSPGATERHGRGSAGWYGGNNKDTVFEVKRPQASREHPTSKPVELVERHLLNSTRPGDIVYDPFAGSGSTLIACERLGRKALVIEIDERYCDVICARYQRETGIMPVVGGEPRDYLLVAPPSSEPDDPLAGDYDPGDEVSSEDQKRKRYEKRVLREGKKDTPSLYQVIMAEGGLRSGNDLKEEHREIPLCYRNGNGLALDEMADHLARHHPEFGIRTERDLIDALIRRKRAA